MTIPDNLQADSNSYGIFLHKILSHHKLSSEFFIYLYVCFSFVCRGYFIREEHHVMCEDTGLDLLNQVYFYLNWVDKCFMFIFMRCVCG